MPDAATVVAPFVVRLRRIEVGAAPSEDFAEQVSNQSWDLIGDPKTTGVPEEEEGDDLVVGHLFWTSKTAFCQVLALAYLKPRRGADDAELPYTPEALEHWAREVGSEVLWDLCRRSAESLAVQMDVDLDLPTYAPDPEWSLRPSETPTAPADTSTSTQQLG